jgi:hypothetical protein
MHTTFNAKSKNTLLNINNSFLKKQKLILIIILASENRKKYDIGADELHRRVKDCLKKQKNHFKIMEDHYLKENMDVKRALALAIRELEFKSHKL